MKRSAWMFVVLIGSLLLITQFTAVAEPATPQEEPVWSGSPPGTQITSANCDDVTISCNPVVVYAPSGANRMIVFNQDVGSDNSDPYYSNFSGGSWSNPAPIYESGDNSVQVTAAYRSGVATAVWIERQASGDRLFAGEEPFPDTTATIISASNFPGFATMFDPDMISSGNTLHVVWGEGLPPIIRYAKSSNGTSWTNPTVAVNPSGADSVQPEIALDSLERANLVWEELSGMGDESAIMFARGTVSGSSFSTPIAISGSITRARQPNIIVVDDKIMVTFTNFLDEDTQSVYLTECATGCLNPNNWSNPELVSGQFVGVVTANPFNIVSDMAHDTKTTTTYLYFHGSSNSTTEQILGVNSCDDWDTVARDEVTTTATRAINPNIAIFNGTIQLVFEVIDNTTHHIYHRSGSLKCTRFIYLPVIARN